MADLKTTGLETTDFDCEKIDANSSETTDGEKTVANSSETSKSAEEPTDKKESAAEMDNEESNSPEMKTNSANQDDNAEKCDVQEKSPLPADSVKEAGLDSAETSAADEAKCPAEEPKGDNITLPDEETCVSESAEVISSQQSSLHQTKTVSETSAVREVTNSTTFSSEQSSTQIVKQTLVSSSQESTVTQSFESLTTEMNFKGNSSENLLDPEKISELRRSPYYDSLIASRISMESETMATVEGEVQSIGESDASGQVNGTSQSEPSAAKDEILVSDHNKTEKQISESSVLQNEVVSNTVCSLKESCQQAVSAAPQVNHKATTEMFKVTKFEPKPFSELKSNSELTFTESFLSNSEESYLFSNQVSEFPKTAEVQAPSTEEDMGVPPANEDVPFRYSPNAYKPASDDDMDFADLPRKKKMFSSSSFYEEPNAIYPTVEEQVELCRKIADSLSDDSNKKSKGANMFFKRVKRAEKWVVESMGTGYDDDYYESSRAEEVGTPDPSKAPYVRISKGPAQLKLILDPRHLLDMKRLRQEGVNIVEHNAVSPEICLDLVKDLNSPTGRGAQLFAKRKKKSEEWVVDEEKVRQLLRERESGYTSSPEPPSTLPYGTGVEPMVFPRVQMLKTPWAAAMESPIGSCTGAFKDIHPNEVAESVIRAAETKIMKYPTPVKPVIEPVIKPESNVQLQNYPPPPPQPVFTPVAPAFAAARQQRQTSKLVSTSSFRVGVYTADPYKPRAPRGWTGVSSGDFQFHPVQQPPHQQQQQQQQPPSLSAVPEPVQLENMMPTTCMPSSKLTHQPSIIKSYNFTNFNKSPRAWNEAIAGFENVNIKPVKPPSVLVQ